MPFPPRPFRSGLLAAVLSGLGLPAQQPAPQPAAPPARETPAADYAIVVCERTQAAWANAVTALQQKHTAAIVTWKAKVDEALPRLRELTPRFACFVAQPAEADREFVIAVHRLTRKLDDDPYGDCLWGILTGFDEGDLLRVVGRKEPLTVGRGAGGTGVPLDLFREGAFWSEGEAGVWWEKVAGGQPQKKSGPADSTQAIVAELNGGAQFFLTSGHATPDDWQIGFSYKNGQLRCRDGALFGLDLGGAQHPIAAAGPRIYSAAGNCLMGRIVNQHSMALGWIHSAGVDQMTGYVVSTWCGHGGWGVNDYFYLGLHDFAESFFLNNQMLVARLETSFPKTARVEFDRWDVERNPRLIGELAAQHGIGSADEAGLLWDRDTVAFYGDPAWVARLDRQVVRPFEQSLVEADGLWTFTVEAMADGEWARFPAVVLPRRVAGAKVVAGEGIVTELFVMLPLSGRFAKGERRVVRFRGETE